MTEEDLAAGHFVEGTKVRSISERFPGTLCQQALSVMQENLLTEVGEDLSSSKVRPISLLYYRQQLQKKATGATSRELLTICSCLDHLVRGRPSHCADILAQRLKSIESTLQGSHWSVSQKMEVVNFALPIPG